MLGFGDRYGPAFKGLTTPIAGLTDLLMVRHGGKFENRAGDQEEADAIKLLATGLLDVANMPLVGTDIEV